MTLHAPWVRPLRRWIARRSAAFLSLILLLLAIGEAWRPVVTHYWVGDAGVDRDRIEHLRASPSNDILDEIGGYGYLLGGGYKEGDIADLADRLIDGRIALANGRSISLDPYFSADDLSKGSSSWQLNYAGFVVPRILLLSYEATGSEAHFDAARRFILRFAAFERRATIPAGFLWNDHAVTVRVVVLSRFWRHYRHHPSFNQEDGAAVIQLAARSLKLLAADRQFTFATNHGVMQSLAFMHGCVAFPNLVCMDDDRDRVIGRLKEQLGYYVNREGVILEHSAGYQEAGVELLGYAFKYLSLLGREIPEDWLEKYARALSIYAAFRRPDGSLPRLGDTISAPDPDGPAVARVERDGRVEPLGAGTSWEPDLAQTLLPAAGYAIWWDGLGQWPGPDGLAQTLVAWSYYPGHGHKHADETGAIVWAEGERWWTATGYAAFPPNKSYRGPWGHSATWEASNAAHLVNEDVAVERATEVLGYGWSPTLAAIDLERSEGSGFRARRQLVRIPPNIWIVIDSFADAQDRRARTVWMSDLDKIHSEDPMSGLWTIVDPQSDSRMKVALLGSPEPAVRRVRGSLDPYAGWVAAETNRLVSAPAFIVEQASRDAWTGLVSSIEHRDEPLLTARPDMRRWQDATRWTLLVPTAQGPTEVRRDGDRLSVVAPPADGLGQPRRDDLTLAPTPDVSSQVLAVKAAFSAASEKYGKRFRDLIPYRWKVTYALLGLFVLQEVFLALWRRYAKRGALMLRLASSPLWAALIVWAIPAYFAS